MRKKIFSIVTIIAILLGTCTVAFANEESPSATRNALKSYGSVIYSDGANNSVAIYSDDLYTLADQLDMFKLCISDQLAKLNTYFSSGDNGINLISNSNLNIVHTQPASTTVDPLSLNFDTLLEGIAASQSIPTDISEYGYSDGTNLFKTPSGLLTLDGAQSSAEQINISAATPENLSAGTAAWVDGTLILGTGADNQAYYNLGYSQGYIDGVHYTTAKANISYVYHKHSGSATSGGGCYTIPYTIPGYSIGAYGKLDIGQDHPNVYCKACNGYLTNYRYEHFDNNPIKLQEWLDNYHHYGCPKGTPTQTGWSLGCGKTEKTIESATIHFN